MERINLCEQRSFSDLITATVNFLKQEFVPFIRAFAVIGFPVILVMLFLMKDVLLDMLNMSISPQMNLNPDVFGETMVRTMLTWLSGVLVILWVQLFSISYLRVYWDHYRESIEERITVAEVFRVMLKKVGVYIVWSLFYGVIVIVGMVFLLIPGIYFGVALMFGSFILILKDGSLGNIMSESMAIVKGNWWKTFLYCIVLSLLVGVVAYVFQIPYMVIMLSSTFTGEVPGAYEITFSLLFSNLGQYTLHSVMFVGIGMMFFSRIEGREHTTLLSQIDQLGAESEKKSDEGGN